MAEPGSVIDGRLPQKFVLVDPNGNFLLAVGGSSAVVGNVAAGATDSGAPVKIGLIYNTTPPTLTDGKRGDAQGDSTGGLIVNQKPLGPGFDFPSLGATPVAVRQTTATKVDFATSGDHNIVAGVSAKVVAVYRVLIVVGGATNITFEDGTTALTGAIPLLANSSIVLDFQSEPWFVTSTAAAFNINSSLAVQVSGAIWATQL